MDAKKVEVLLEAIEAGSLMSVAENSGYTPSGLSHLLHRLEEELGVSIVLRTNRGIELSEEGKALLPYLKNYADSFRALEKKAELLCGKGKTVLHIGAYASIAKNWMPLLLRAFGREYPQINTELEVLSRQELYRAMKEGRLRVIFACEDKTQKYSFLHLADDPFFAVLPQNEEGLRGITTKYENCKLNSTITDEGKKDTAYFTDVCSEETGEVNKFAIKDFEKFPFIMPSYGEDVEVHEQLEQNGVKPRLLPASADDPVILGMVAGGMGVTMLSELVLRGSSEPIRKLPIHPPCSRPLGIVHQEEKKLSEAEKEFIKFTKKFISDLI